MIDWVRDFGRRAWAAGMAPAFGRGKAPARDSETEPGSPASSAQVGGPAPSKSTSEIREADVSPEGQVERDEAHRLLNDRLTELEAEFADTDSDALTLLEDLAALQPGAIRQPPVAAKSVLRLLRRRNYSLDEVTTLIGRDPSLAQALLKHANSAWFATPGGEPVVSLSSATQRVGTNGVHATVMASMMQGGLTRPGAGFNDFAAYVWDHMVRVGPIARHLAKGFSADPDEAFTLGLSHDVGKLVLFDRIADLRRRLRRDIELPTGFLDASLRELHEPLGAIAAFEWGLAPRFASLIGSHHRRTPPQEPEPLSETLFVAERLDLALQKGQYLNLKYVWQVGALSTSADALAELIDEATVAALTAASEKPPPRSLWPTY